MIWATGDCHGNFERFKPEYFPEQAEMTKEDTIIIKRRGRFYSKRSHLFYDLYNLIVSSNFSSLIFKNLCTL
mgnify:CR=1 FL=1